LFAYATLTALLLETAPALAENPEPWLVLPPTPDLPKANVAGPLHVNDIEMWLVEFGPAERPVVMVHGGLANSSYIGNVIPFLTAEGFHVIRVDSRGHGRGTGSAQPYTYELMACDVVAMMDALQVAKADLVGWRCDHRHRHGDPQSRVLKPRVRVWRQHGAVGSRAAF
jgi:pimeloyl-ACP methyl ester carboxylesterase